MDMLIIKEDLCELNINYQRQEVARKLVISLL